MISFDLKSGYHHVDIHPEYQCFLGFSWQFKNGVTRYFVFTVLPSGLSTAPHIFTKVLKPLEKHWRIQGFKMALFLDDGIVMEQDENPCRVVAHKIRSDLKRSGFITNDAIWKPAQTVQWLGLVWDSPRASVSICERRLVSLEETINHIFEKDTIVSARELSSFVGKVISASEVYGNLARLMTRYCTISIDAG